ncbi:AGE family epimerase/isomerase [Parabacteroides sp. Marseille-P3160]|uniref:AGE family epimerase/isomerase n=1 Tax=Parabacteroides sp. Marseille-P3160 TaxID=1917887 RepID=UPI0009BAB386|nr:AGE family epimerase/isomerase [Parabacteroides sp. Marseille-P3160]
MKTRKYLKEWAEKYRQDLVSDILPFWMKYGLDQINGGIYTCLDHKGQLMDSTKSVWFQGRFAFVCAFAYNNIEKKAEWLSAAHQTIEFIEKYCFDTDGRMFFEVTATGIPLRKRRYIFSETFAIIAMAEYAIASGDRTYAKKALELFKRTQSFITTPGMLPDKYTQNLKLKGHSLTMILINTASRIRAAIKDPVLDIQIEESIQSIKNDFLHVEFKALLETVNINGGFVDTIMGRTINPGHCIETAWFILEEAKYRNWDKKLIELGTTILEWSWDWGWDKKYGGINNFRDCKNFPAQDYSHDMKFWWPHTEAIIATLYAFEATRDEKYLAMHQQISEYTYKHFPDKEYGEWYGYLHFDGSVSQSAKGNLFKGPFHIPRMMIKSYMICNEIIKRMT